MSKVKKQQSVQLYCTNCFNEHRRRQELFSERWIGADYFHEYLLSIEPYAEVLEAELDHLVQIYFRRGKNEFRNFDHEAKDPAKQKLSELLTKYVIEEKPQKSGFEIGILELVKIRPLQIALQLRLSTARPFGDFNQLPKCLAFNGGIYLIPETEDWEPTTVLWKMWKGSVERPPNGGDLCLPEEYVLPYRTPSHFNRIAAMASLNVQPFTANKVMSIMRKAMADFAGLDCELNEEQIKLYSDSLFPSYSDQIYNFYTKNANSGMEKSNRRKPIAATFSKRSVRSPGTIVQTLRNSLRLKKEPSPPPNSERLVQRRLAADFKGRNTPLTDESTDIEFAEGMQSEGHFYKDYSPQSRRGGAKRKSQQGNEKDFRSTFLPPLLTNLTPHGDRKIDEQSGVEDNETGPLRVRTQFVTPTSQNSQPADSRAASWGSPVNLEETSSLTRSSPVGAPAGAVVPDLPSSPGAVVSLLKTVASGHHQPAIKDSQSSKAKVRGTVGLQTAGAVRKPVDPPSTATGEPISRSRTSCKQVHSASQSLSTTKSENSAFKHSNKVSKETHLPSPIDSDASGRADQRPLRRLQNRQPKTKILVSKG